MQQQRFLSKIYFFLVFLPPLSDLRGFVRQHLFVLKLDACQVDLFRFIFSQLATSQSQLGGPVEQYEQWA